MKKQTYRIEDNHYKELQKKLIDNDMSFQGFVDKCVNQYLAGFYDPKDAEGFWRKEMIKKMAGKNVDVDYGWLKENDPETLAYIQENKYCDFQEEETVLEVQFDENGTRYYVCAKWAECETPSQNQPPWWEDSWGNWETKDIAKYYNEL